jgi:hypothetical protein
VVEADQVNHAVAFAVFHHFPQPLRTAKSSASTATGSSLNWATAIDADRQKTTR